MKLLLPENIYAKLYAGTLENVKQEELVFTPSAAISKDLDEGKGDIALIPSMDLLNHPHFYVSGKTALSFDGALSNSYFYFLKQIRLVKEVYLRGDVSKNDVILAKIIFSEQFESDVQVFLDSKPFELNTKNYLICGDDNFKGSIYEAGLSLADQINDLIDAPYVNYIIASKNEEMLKEFNKGINSPDKFLEDNFDAVASKLGYHQSIVDSIKEDQNSIYFDMTENEKKALTDLIHLPYFTGVVEDMIEIKFVG